MIFEKMFSVQRHSITNLKSWKKNVNRLFMDTQKHWQRQAYSPVDLRKQSLKRSLLSP